MNESELARMVKQWPELLAAPRAFADAIQWARFPAQLDHGYFRLPCPPVLEHLHNTGGHDLTRLRAAPRRYLYTVQAVIHYATNQQPATGPLNLIIDRYLPSRRSDTAHFINLMLIALPGYLYADNTQIAGLTLRNHIDRKHPHVTIAVTKKGTP